MDLDRLNKALGTFDTAAYIFSLDDGKTLQKCLEIADAANSYDDQVEAGVRKVIKGPDADVGDPATIRGALKNSPGHNGSIIKVGANKSALGLHGKTVRRAKFDSLEKDDNSSAAFSKASNQVSKAQRTLTSEDHMENSKELQWIAGSQRNKVRMIKSAALKSLANRKACQEEFDANRRYKLSPVVESMLAKKAAESRALKEVTNTPAAKTIVAKGTPSAQAVAKMLDVPVVPDSKTRAAIPPEFQPVKPLWLQPKITPSVDNSFGAAAARTKAASTIARPVASRDVPNPETNDQGEIADKYFGAGKSRPTASTKPAKDKTNPKTREGQWPANPGDIQYPEETASSRYPDSRW